MGRRVMPEAGQAKLVALRDRQRQLEELVTAWWCADATRREAQHRLDALVRGAQARVDACVADCEAVCVDLLAAGMPPAEVASMIDQTERAVVDLARRATATARLDRSRTEPAATRSKHHESMANESPAVQ
jgi:hypothetical protein